MSVAALSSRNVRPCAACMRRLAATAASRSLTGSAKLNVAGSSRTPTRESRRAFSSSTLRSAKKTVIYDTGSNKVVNMDDFPPERIRNLSIIAHIDHGKSTLADRLLQMTNTVPSTSSPQFLDKLKVERERGITVKAQTVSIIHTHTDGQQYLINLIDTPGHVDFSYEVSRSLGACEGALLLVDCTQGIQAQTLSVFHVALEADLTMLAVINKVDLPHASPEDTSDQIEVSLGLESEKHMQISAKSGLGVQKVLDQIIDGLPAPTPWAESDGKLRGLVFDTHYDHFRGVVSLVRVMSGSIRVGDKVRFLQAQKKYEVLEIGINNPEEVPVEVLHEGQVGYVICSMKNMEEAFIGDTLCHEREPVEPLPGFKPMKAMVYAGIFPMETSDHAKLEEAIDRLTLNDRSVTVARESSAALSLGWRLGFLGTLHMDVFRQRLEDEYSSNVIVTAPTVPYKVVMTKGEDMFVSNPANFPDGDPRNKIQHVEEPMVHATIMVPNEYIGDMMDLCSRYRGTQTEYKILETSGRAMLRYDFPLSEIVTDFYSALKSASSGFASFDYEEAGYMKSDMVKMNILLNGKPVDALAMIVHRSAAHNVGKGWVKKLKDVVPRQLFELAIQAAVGAKVVARETLPANRKDVTAGLYGGHWDRKAKQLNKQKEGKKRLKSLAGNIQMPQAAFFDVLSTRPRSFSTLAIQPNWAAAAFPSSPSADHTISRTDYAKLFRNVSQTVTAHLRSFSISQSITAPAARSSDPILQHIDKKLPSHSLPPPRRSRPISLPEISPIARSKQLSELNEISAGPILDEDAAALYAKYAQLYAESPDSHMLTPSEIEAIIHRIRKLDMAGRLPIDQRSRRNRVLGMHKLDAANEGPLTQDVGHWNEIYALSFDPSRPQKKGIRYAEKVLENLLQRQPKESIEGRIVSDFFLRMVAASGDRAKFEEWVARLEDLGWRTSVSVRLFKLSIVRKLDSTQELQREVEVVITTLTEGHIRVLNFWLQCLADSGDWDAVAPIYSALVPTSIFPLNARTRSTVTVPEGVRADRHTFALIVRALSHRGDLLPALAVMRDMIANDLIPFLAEYAALFEGFGLHGVIAPANGAASVLFPASRYSPGTAFAVEPEEELESILPEFWSRRRKTASIPENPWSLETMDTIFDTFMASRPGGREVRGKTNAPGPDMVWQILFAYNRMTGGDAGVLLQKWKAMDEKFSQGGWTKWAKNTANHRLSKVVEGLQAAERLSVEVD